MAVEAVAIVIAVALAVITFVAADVALLVIVGVMRISRCGHCRRPSLTRTEGPLSACVRCRHERLFHPVLTSHHAAPRRHGAP
jgi:hypothetical protein